jgi:CRISPR/Cas system-associated exonuclease Cas4 (RecB family)
MSGNSYLVDIPEQDSFIISLLEQDLIEGQDEHPPKFRVSFAGQCFLKRILFKRGVKPSDPPSPRALRIFEIGNIIHLYLQNFLEKHKLLLFKELELEDDKRIGHLDALVQDGDKLILYDFKTVNSVKFPTISGVSVFHIFQIVSYYVMLIDAYFLKADSIRLLYISKDDLSMKEFEIDVRKWVDIVEQDWYDLYEFEEGIYKRFPRFEWECKYCSFRSFCSKNDLKNKWEYYIISTKENDGR